MLAASMASDVALRVTDNPDPNLKGRRLAASDALAKHLRAARRLLAGDDGFCVERRGNETC